MKPTSLFLIDMHSYWQPDPAFAAVTVKPVPWDPTNLTSPHTVVAGTVATLTATVDLGGSADTFTYFWKFGDGSANQAPRP